MEAQLDRAQNAIANADGDNILSQIARGSSPQPDRSSASVPVRVPACGEDLLVDTKRVVQGSTMLEIHQMPSLEELEESQEINRSSKNVLEVPG